VATIRIKKKEQKRQKSEGKEWRGFDDGGAFGGGG